MARKDDGIQMTDEQVKAARVAVGRGGAAMLKSYEAMQVQLFSKGLLGAVVIDGMDPLTVTTTLSKPGAKDAAGNPVPENVRANFEKLQNETIIPMVATSQVELAIQATKMALQQEAEEQKHARALELQAAKDEAKLAQLEKQEKIAELRAVGKDTVRDVVAKVNASKQDEPTTGQPVTQPGDIPAHQENTEPSAAELNKTAIEAAQERDLQIAQAQSGNLNPGK